MYQLLYKKSVEKDIRKLPKGIRAAIVIKIQNLAKNPRPNGCTKLKGSTDLFRIRHNNYRIIYSINSGQLTIMVIKIAHRKDVYRDF